MKKIVLLLMLLVSIGMKAQSPIPDGYYSVELFRVVMNDKDVMTERVMNDLCYMTINDGGSIVVLYMMNYPAITCRLSDWERKDDGITYFNATDVHSAFKSRGGVALNDDGIRYNLVIERGNGRSDLFVLRKTE